MLTKREFLTALQEKTIHTFKDVDIANEQLCSNGIRDMDDLHFINVNFTDVCWCTGIWRYLQFTSCKFTNVRFPSYIRSSSFVDCEISNNNFPFNSEGCVFKDCKVEVEKWGSPSRFLQHEWGNCSDELTKELMRYDAANHPDPETFNAWAFNTMECPYLVSGVSVSRVANFTEKPELWSPSLLEKPAKSAYELMQMIIREKFKVIN